MKTKMMMACLVAAMTMVAAAAPRPAPNRPANGGAKPALAAKPGAKPAARKIPAGGKRKVVVVPARAERDLPPGAQRLMDAIDDAESMRELMRLLPSARQSPHSEIRLAMVNALEEHEHRGINELAYFIGDSNREVSEAAFSAWSTIVEDFHLPSARVAAICDAAKILQAGVGVVPAVPVAVPVAQPVAQPVVQQQVVQPVQQQVVQPVQQQVVQPVQQVVAPATP